MPVIVVPPALRTVGLDYLVLYSTEKLLAEPGQATLLSRILQKCNIHATEQSRWCLVDGNDAVLSEGELRALEGHARVHLSSVDSQPRQYVELKKASSADAKTFISAPTHSDHIDFLRVNASVIDALLEWIDNAIKALQLLAAGEPTEVWFGFYVDDAGELHLFVRDTGAGIVSSRLEVWPSLGNVARKEAEPEHPADAGRDPRVPYGPGLGQWRVGAKKSMAVTTGSTGRTEVYTRAAGDPRGCDGDVAYLIFDNAVAKARDDAARANGGNAAPGSNWYDLEAAVVPPTAVQRGIVDDPTGGRWHASGTLVNVSGCSDLVKQLFREEHAFYSAAQAAGDTNAASPVAKAVAMVYHSFIHKQRMEVFAPAGAEPMEDGSDDESSLSGASAAVAGARGKAGKKVLAKGKALVVEEKEAQVKLTYCFITDDLQPVMRNCAEVRGDLVSRMMAVGNCSDPASVFNLRLAIGCAARPGAVAIAHITMMYYPYVDGAESLPEELAKMSGGRLVVRRCGRVLQRKLKPMRQHIPLLGALGTMDSRDGSYSKAMQALRLALQQRTAGFADLSVTFTPTTDKCHLDSECAFTAALNALSEGSPEDVARVLKAADATVQMTVSGPGIPVTFNGVSQPFDAVKLRDNFLSWARNRHLLLDKEAAYSMPDGAKPHVFVVPESFPGNDLAQFSEPAQRFKSGEYLSFFRQLTVFGEPRPKVMPERPDQPGQVRVFFPKAAMWPGKLEKLKGFCPPCDDGYLFTLRGVVAPGAPSDDPSSDKCMVVLEPWTADPQAAAKTGIALRDSCVGFELKPSAVELADGLKAMARMRRACVRPMNSLLQANGVVWLSEEQFWDKARAIKLPASLVLLPLQWKQVTRNEIRVTPAAIEVHSATPALTNVPFAVMHNQNSRGQAEWLVDASMQVRLTMHDSAGKSVLDGDAGLLASQVGEGKYCFMVPLSAAGPGDYTLTAQAKPLEGRCPTFCVDVPVLTCVVRIKARIGLAAGSGSISRGCVHAGVCTAVGGAVLARNAACPRFVAAGLTLQLHATAPLAQLLIFTQREKAAGTAYTSVRWPAELTMAGDQGRYDVSFDILDDRLSGKCDIKLAAQPKLALSADGLELRVTDVRLAGGTLPAGDAYRDAANKNRAAAAPISARLAMTVTDRGDPDESDPAPTTVVASVALEVAPGPLHVLRPESDDGEPCEAVADISGPVMRALRNMFGKTLSVGDTTLRASLRDHSGNLTMDHAPDLRLAWHNGFQQIGQGKNVSVEQGVASMKLRLPLNSRSYRAALQAAGVTDVQALEINGSVPARYVRLQPAAQFATAVRAVAGSMLDLTGVTATVVRGSTAADATPDTAFVGTLHFEDAASPTSAWSKALLDCGTPLVSAAVKLPALPMPDKAGEHKLRIIARNAEGAEATREEVTLRVVAGPAARLRQPPGATKTVPAVLVDAPVRVTVIAQDQGGNSATLTAAQLAVLEISVAGRDTNLTGGHGAVRLVQVEAPKTGAEPGAVTFVVRLIGPAPQVVELTVKLPLPADDMDDSDSDAPDTIVIADRCAEVSLRYKLNVGPPCPAMSRVTLEGTEEAEGYFKLRCGDAKPVGIEVRDAFGNVAAVMAGAAVELAARAGCGVTLPPRAIPTWTSGIGRVVALSVAADARLGRLPMCVKVWVEREKPPMELPLLLRIEEGVFASQLLAEMADGSAIGIDADGTPLLIVQAGAPLPLRARARTSNGGVPQLTQQQRPALLMRPVAGAGAPQPPTLPRLLSDAVDADTAVFTFAATAVAPTVAGGYKAELMLPGASVAVPPCSVKLRLHVTPCLTQLRLALRGSNIATDLIGRAAHDGGGVLVSDLVVGVEDVFGNAVSAADALAAMRGARVRLDFFVHGSTWESAPGSQAEAVEVSLSEDGTAVFGRIVAGAGCAWRNGSYRLVASVVSDADDAEVAESEALDFEFRRAGKTVIVEVPVEEGVGGLHPDDEAKRARRAAAEKAVIEADSAYAAGLRAVTTSHAASAAADAALGKFGGDAAAARVRLAAEAPATNAAVQLSKTAAYVAKHNQHALNNSAPRCFGLVMHLLRAEGPDLAKILAVAAGGRALNVLCRTQADVTALEAPDKLGSSLMAQPLEDNRDIVTPEEDVFHLSGQLPLRLAGAAASWPGFVGYLVNLVRLSQEHLAVRVTLRTATGAARRVGLRATALYSVFGDAALFTTRAAMLAFNDAHGAGAGLYCLDCDACVLRGGVRSTTGAAHAAVRAAVAPGDEWRAAPLRMDACAVAEAAACHEAERQAEASLQQLTAARAVARAELNAARGAAPRPPVDIAPAGAGGRGRQRPDAESAARAPKRPRTSGA